MPLLSCSCELTASRTIYIDKPLSTLIMKQAIKNPLEICLAPFSRTRGNDVDKVPLPRRRTPTVAISGPLKNIAALSWLPQVNKPPGREFHLSFQLQRLLPLTSLTTRRFTGDEDLNYCCNNYNCVDSISGYQNSSIIHSQP